jgi:hypothetical protein
VWAVLKTAGIDPVTDAVQPNDILVALGTPENLDALTEAALAADLA